MTYYMPVKIHDEENAVRNHAAELSSFGEKALIVTGRRSAERCGALSDVTSALEEHGRKYCIFPEIEENPSVETVVRGCEFGLAEKADFVIGIGGGSPLDAAKAIAFLMHRGEPAAEALYDKELPSDALPVIAVPTTCGTGSEVTGVSVLTVHAKRTKGSIPHKIFPELALIDGKYLKNAPLSVIASTSGDALAHMIESFESKKADDYSRAAVLSGLKIWGEVKDVLDGSRGPSADDLAKLMRASTFAGIAIAQTGTSIPHALSYILTYDLKMPHGKACCCFLPAFLEEASAGDQEMILLAAGFRDTAEFRAFFENVFGGIYVPEETLERAYSVVSANEARLKGCRFHADAEVLRRIADAHL